ncbi:DNA-binding transcriptional regulator, XRE-family HTH domain [Oceanobacillus limi]|uniref:DNA-binding transcriptional regulator, XRE-family HTH domain n=1 Tax=Oceanobacillus limi TaxID=930131 RepID=A0A1I0F8L1_9BACI|nr:helix-turn-helix transcriptional regulator [Oceanobacillus limi]SET54499.1 DNA-binding transcriptional regulator, XRE-family HTH domain [Oceanobacillus limi]
MEGFGKRLKALREQQALSPEQMAEQIGFTKSVIWSYEMEKKEPSISHVKRISKFFDVSIDYLLNGNTPKQPLRLEEKNVREGHMLMVDNRQLSEEEIIDAIAFIKAKRLLKEVDH